jgi:hypothetical protein
MRNENERMQHALWSVYFTARGLDPSVLPRKARPIPVEEGLDVLHAHQDQNRGARRRRALLEAGAGNLHSRHPRAVADRAKALAKKLQIDPDVLTHVGTERAEDGADLLLADAHHHGWLDCVAVKTLDLKVEYDPRSHDSTLKVVSRVNRRIEDMGFMVDPRHWKLCSDFFKKSDPVDPKTMEPVQMQLGQRWQMHEVFATPIATFENLLNITYTIDTRHEVPWRFTVVYSLYESLSCTYVGETIDGVHERNSGEITAVRDPRYPDQTQMTTTKTLRFRDLTPEDPVEGGIDQGQWLNYCAPAMLGLWIDEANQGRVCCRHP